MIRLESVVAWLYTSRNLNSCPNVVMRITAPSFLPDDECELRAHPPLLRDSSGKKARSISLAQGLKCEINTRLLLPCVGHREHDLTYRWDRIHTTCISEPEGMREYKEWLSEGPEVVA